MTIETGPAPTGVKTAASSEANGAKGKSSATAKGGPQGGFSAILESLESDAPAKVAVSDDDALPLAKGDATAEPVLDAAALLAQSLQLPAQPTEDGASPLGHAHNPGGKSAPKASDLPLQVSADKSEPNPLLQTGRAQQDARAKNALASTAQAAQSASSEQDAARQPKFAAALEAAKAQQPVVDPGVVAAAVPSIGDKPAQERSVFKSETSSSVPASAPVGSTGASTEVASVSDSAVAPDVRAAEQVTYWISQDVQKAEMKLDGVGEKPVEVSISMQGNEAQVAFRTDEVQTRAVLESASAHLKDMLQREGVMLTGVSVGTSGAGDSGAQERRPRQGGKQALVEVAQTASPMTRAAGAGVSGRAVDLFV